MPIEVTSRPEAALEATDEVDDDRRRLVDALQRCGGNQTEAARLLGISRRTLVSRLTAYNVPRPRKLRALQGVEP